MRLLFTLSLLAFPWGATASECLDLAQKETLAHFRAELPSEKADSERFLIRDSLVPGEGSYAFMFSAGEIYIADTFMENGQCQLSFEPWAFRASAQIDLRQKFENQEFALTAGPGFEILLPADVNELKKPDIYCSETWSDAECQPVGYRRWEEDGKSGWAVSIHLLAGDDGSGCAITASDALGRMAQVRVSILD